MYAERATLLQEPPYVTVKEGHVAASNDDFEGYIPDLLRQVARRLGRTYSLQLVPDGRYGKPPSGSGGWTGLIGEVVAGVSARHAAAPTGSHNECLITVNDIINRALCVYKKSPSSKSRVA